MHFNFGIGLAAAAVSVATPVSEQSVFDGAIRQSSGLAEEFTEVNGVSSLDGSAVLQRGTKSGRYLLYIRDAGVTCAIEPGAATDIVSHLLAINISDRLVRSSAVPSISLDTRILRNLLSHEDWGGDCVLHTSAADLSSYSILFSTRGASVVVTKPPTGISAIYRAGKRASENLSQIHDLVVDAIKHHQGSKLLAVGMSSALFSSSSGYAARSLASSGEDIPLQDFSSAKARAATWPTGHKMLFRIDPASMTDAAQYEDLLVEMTLGREYREPAFDFFLT